jgi:hypothetical protein
MSTRAKPCVGYWAACYINRDEGWSVACDALGRIIRCETEKLALSVARYRRRRLQPLRGGNPNLARTEKRHGRHGAGRALLFSAEVRRFPSLAPPSDMARTGDRPRSKKQRRKETLGPMIYAANQRSSLDATKKRAQKLEAKGKAVDLKELLRMELTAAPPTFVNSAHWKRWLEP